MNPITIITLYFCLGVLLTYILLDTLSKGFISTFLSVRFSRDKKTLIEIHGASKVYYTTAKEVGGSLSFKDQNKEKHLINASRDHFCRKMNVNCLSYDEVGKFIIKPFGEIAASIDPVRNENTHERALTAPDVKSNSQKMKNGIIILGICIALIGILWLSYQNMEKLDILYNLIKAGCKGTI